MTWPMNYDHSMFTSSKVKNTISSISCLLRAIATHSQIRCPAVSSSYWQWRQTLSSTRPLLKSWYASKDRVQTVFRLPQAQNVYFDLFLKQDFVSQYDFHHFVFTSHPNCLQLSRNQLKHWYWTCWHFNKHLFNHRSLTDRSSAMTKERVLLFWH